MNKATEQHTHTHLESPAIDANPIVVEITRGTAVESRHRGSAVVVDQNGHVMASWGSLETPVFPRSAIKSVQAIPFIETGAAEAFGLGNKEIALACASHNGEQKHIDVVSAWLQKIGLSEENLECGTHWPFDKETASNLIKLGKSPSALHTNCSGKHAAMLTTALHMSETAEGYVRIEHPCQQRVMGTLESMCGLNFDNIPRGIDGCAIPTFSIPLGNIALAMARIAAPDALPSIREAAVTCIRRAIAAEPYMIAGRNRYCSEIIELTGGRLIVKTGAEGVFAAAVPEIGAGIALKCDDGATRASEIMMTAILSNLNVFDNSMIEELKNRLRIPLKNRNGATVGEIRAAATLSF